MSLLGIRKYGYYYGYGKYGKYYGYGKGYGYGYGEYKVSRECDPKVKKMP